MSQPTKKRALMMMASPDEVLQEEGASTTTTTGIPKGGSAAVARQRPYYPTTTLASNHHHYSTGSSNKSASSSSSSSSGWTANLDASVYKAELEHERSLRSLDNKRAKQAQQRLERQVEFAVEEAQSAKNMLEEERKQIEIHMEQLRQARDDAVQQLRELQYAQSNHNNGNYDDDYDSDEEGEEQQRDSMWQKKCELLQFQTEAKDEEIIRLKGSLSDLRTQWEESLQRNKQDQEAPVTPKEKSVEGQSSPAPAEILAELNRVRIALAESERKERQARRAAEEWQKKVKQLLPEREAARSSRLRMQQLETQLREVRQKYESTVAQNEQWQYFGKTLAKHFSIERDDYTSPPELTAVLRQAEAAKKELEQVKYNNHSMEERLKKIQDWKRPADARMKLLDEQETKWKEERKELERQLDLQTRQVETLQKQEAIWKRENASLQRLVQTFDELPLNTSGTSSTVGASSAKLQTIELELTSRKEELQVVQQDRIRIKNELTRSTEELEVRSQELDRVKEKYGRLREALEVQRQKTQEAEARAVRAEELSGTGSYNPAETRVLHMQQNPLSETLQQQNARLRKQLQEALQSKGGGSSLDVNVSINNASVSGSEVDPDKLHQRLKQSFKEQIGLFREGVHLITGYKIDMLPVDDRPTFRVRSMYGEKEEDTLMFKWPKLPEGQHPSSLDLLGTEWAQTLTATEAYEYITRYKSLPAFVAALQLKLFENQTFMG